MKVYCFECKWFQLGKDIPPEYNSYACEHPDNWHWVENFAGRWKERIRAGIKNANNNCKLFESK